MKLFIREQLPLIFIYILQLLIIMMIYWLDGYRHLSISIYAAILSGSLLIGYLVFRYLRHRSFYQRLEKPFAQLEDFANDIQTTPLAEGLQQLLESQFRHYRTDLYRYKHKLDGHIQFINQWVHQMKTPISVIHLTIQDEDDPRFIAIGDELDRLKKGLEMVLYTARLDTFERDFYVESLSLENVVRAVTSSQKRLFIRKRIFPSIQINHDIQIASDEKWLSFIITQTITNALRYTIHENRKIYFNSYRRGISIVLEITDEGVGIPPSDLPRVFDPYFTGENGRHFQESTGMGLYLVKQICEKLGHQIEIESKINQGTTIRLVF
ncbi:sensor histidine kinase [Heyndrickxia oleronia]|jgi:signal transduction histidine kinase|uniref:sensor histidine kinase n=1 Tax=Heyndrickxia oleronia TaxID=38875 RepID=UPI00242B7E89|nr:sensor histidine kinase [Heyndrickxia oleronia]MCI1591079.1 sensor histidine kinase [Heyndrickxia oleronia]MCI1614695.1 sensor histidine kinase [Heyndrickxia oleronia]MCI1745570.1 sensor histidine kinase [Heyndrickxia oleronia]MCI1762471.1 sensor histidine kinase [Heyndrickxia oleronia]